MTPISKVVGDAVRKLEDEHENAKVDLNLLIYSLRDCISYLKRFDCEHMPGGVPGSIQKAEARIAKTIERFNLEA